MLMIKSEEDYLKDYCKNINVEEKKDNHNY